MIDVLFIPQSAVWLFDARSASGAPMPENVP